jgi:hypothetical protein
VAEPSSQEGRTEPFTPGGPMAWPVAAMREAPVRLLPWRLLAQPPPDHPAGHAKPQHRQHHSDGIPRRSARRRHQHAGQGPNQRAVQQPGQFGLSQWWPVGAGHGASSGQRGTVPVWRWPADGWVRSAQQAAERRRDSAARGHVGFAGAAAASEGSTRPRHLEERSPPRVRCSVASPLPRQPVIPRHPAGAAVSGRASSTQHSTVGGGCRLAGRSDRRVVRSGRVPGHGPGGTRQPL